MKFRSSQLLLASLIAAAILSGTARADDEGPEIRFEDVPEYVPEAIGGRWYLRGDVGYGWSAGRGGRGSPNIGVGVGYHFNEWLRADATVEMQEGGATVSRAVPADCGGGAGTHCRFVDSATARTQAAFANLYADLGTYAGFTPYAGAGAGLARVEWQHATRSHFCIDGASSCAGRAVGSARMGAGVEWRFAYNVGAGVAYKIGRNLKVDFGYRYQKIAGGNLVSDASGTFASRDSGLAQHQFRVGLRFLLP